MPGPRGTGRTQERETMSALRKMTSFLGYAEPTGDDDGYEDT